MAEETNQNGKRPGKPMKGTIPTGSVRVKTTEYGGIFRERGLFEGEEGVLRALPAGTRHDIEKSIGINAEIDRLANSLAEQGQINHAAMRKKSESGELDRRDTNTATNHLKHYAWPTPPVSPTKFLTHVDPGTPDDLALKERYRLEQEEFRVLLTQDRQLHRAFKDLSELRSWWGQNIAKWRTNRNQLEQHEANIQGFKRSLELLKDPNELENTFIKTNRDIEPYVHYANQVNDSLAEEEERKAVNLNWLIANRETLTDVSLRVSVLSHFVKRIQNAGKMQIPRKPVPGKPTETPEVDVPGDFGFKVDFNLGLDLVAAAYQEDETMMEENVSGDGVREAVSPVSPLSPVESKVRSEHLPQAKAGSTQPVSPELESDSGSKFLEYCVGLDPDIVMDITKQPWYVENKIHTSIAKSQATFLLEEEHLPSLLGKWEDQLQPCYKRIEHHVREIKILKTEGEENERISDERIAAIENIRDNDFRAGAVKLLTWDNDIKSRHEARLNVRERIDNDIEAHETAIAHTEELIEVCEGHIDFIQERFARVCAAAKLVTHLQEEDHGSFLITNKTGILQHLLNRNAYERANTICYMRIRRNVEDAFKEGRITFEERVRAYLPMAKYLTTLRLFGATGRIISNLKKGDEPSLKTALLCYHAMYNDFAKVRKDIKKYIEKMKAGAYETEEIPRVEQTEEAQQEDTWGSCKAFMGDFLHYAQVALKEEVRQGINGEKGPIGQLYRQTFTSPDLFPIFHHVQDMDRNDFLELLNLRIIHKSSARALEIFLLYCNAVQDLFTYSEETGKVSAIEHGWGDGTHGTIAGFERSLFFTPPEGVEDFETFLTDHRELVFHAANGHLITESEIVTIVDKYWKKEAVIDFSKPSLEDISKYLKYFDLSGKLFHNALSNVPHDSGRDLAPGTLLIIENGWRRGAELYELEHPKIQFDEGYYEKFITQVLNRINENGDYARLYVTERISYLYRIRAFQYTWK